MRCGISRLGGMRLARFASALAVFAGMIPGAAYGASGSAPASGSAATSGSAARGDIILGAVGQTRREIEQREKELGYRLEGVRVFRRWDETLLTSDQRWARDTGHTVFLSVKSRRKDGSKIRWRDIASARPGSPLHDDMLRHAREFKDFRKKVYVVFNHEPDASVSRSMGSPADFVAAWRKVVETYRQAGVKNARYVWTMTDWAFSQHGGKNAKAYYPGDTYVHDIAADAYNWHTCKSRNGAWQSMAELIEPHRRFGAKHRDKGLMLLEWGTVEDPGRPGRKAQWLKAVARLFAQPKYRQYKALLYWDDRNTGVMDGTDCDFDYRTSDSSLAAWKSMMAAPAYAAKPLCKGRKCAPSSSGNSENRGPPYGLMAIGGSALVALAVPIALRRRKSSA